MTEDPGANIKAGKSWVKLLPVSEKILERHSDTSGASDNSTAFEVKF